MLLVATGSIVLYLKQNSTWAICHLEKKITCVEKAPLPFMLKSPTKLWLLLPSRLFWPDVSSVFAGCKPVHYHGRTLVKHWVVKGVVFSRGINIQLPKYLGAIPLLPPLHAVLHCLSIKCVWTHKVALRMLRRVPRKNKTQVFFQDCQYGQYYLFVAITLVDRRLGGNNTCRNTVPDEGIPAREQ